MENWGEQTRLVFRLAVGLYLIYGAAFCGYSLFRYFKQCRANREKKPDPPAPEDEP